MIDRFNMDGNQSPRSQCEDDDYGESFEQLSRSSGNGRYPAHDHRYVLKCQKAKKVFTEEEISQLRLNRRKETAEIKFQIDQVLGRQQEDSLEDENEEHELELEMQHILASAITKILDQKSIRDSMANLHELVMNEVNDQMDTDEDGGSKKSLKM